MADLGVFAALVGLFAVVGIALGMLAARRLGAWDERRATAEAGTVTAAGRTGAVPATAEAGTVTAAGRTGSTPDSEPLENGGDTVD